MIVRQAVPADGGGLFVVCAYADSTAADDLAEVRSCLERGDIANAWLIGGDAVRHGAWKEADGPPDVEGEPK